MPLLELFLSRTRRVKIKIKFIILTELMGGPFFSVATRSRVCQLAPAPTRRKRTRLHQPELINASRDYATGHLPKLLLLSLSLPPSPCVPPHPPPITHNRPHAHMFKKMKLAPSPICNCGLEDQMAKHCLLYTSPSPRDA